MEYKSEKRVSYIELFITIAVFIGGMFWSYSQQVSRLDVMENKIDTISINLSDYSSRTQQNSIDIATLLAKAK